MRVTIYPSLLQGKITSIPSKSITHRALICAYLMKQKSIIHNPLICNDTLETINILKELGVQFCFFSDHLIVDSTNVTKAINKILIVKESATTLRILGTLLAIRYHNIIFKVGPRLLNRIKDDDFNQTGISYKIDYEHSLLTLSFQSFDESTFLNVKHSSQAISGLILGLFNIVKSFNIVKPLDPYVLLTLKILEQYNIHITYLDKGEYLNIILSQELNRYEYYCEGDYSTMANFLVAGINGNLLIEGLKKDSIQHDQIIINILQSAGANITQNEQLDQIQITKSKLTPFNLDLSLIPDLGPLLMLLSATIKGTSTFKGLNRLIDKESNRLENTIKIISQIGANVEVYDDYLKITGVKQFKGHQIFNVDGDHRLIFMLTVLSSFFDDAIIINNSEGINKSYPNFFHDFENLGGKISYEDLTVYQ